jgi:uncharacterized membrane protein YfcA
MTVPNELAGLALGLVVGVVMGLLGGGGSILAFPIFLYVFHVEQRSAVAMSLAVVGMAAFVGFLGHWRQGTVNLKIGMPFGTFAALTAFLTARVSDRVPEVVQLSLFAVFALTAAVVMLVDSLRTRSTSASGPRTTSHFTPVLALQAMAVGALTAIIGAGGGFLIVPALVYLASVGVKEAVGTSLLVITLNALSGFVGYIGEVPIDWALVGSFTGIAALGAILGTRLNRHVPQVRIKQGFALLILTLWTIVMVRSLMT